MKNKNCRLLTNYTTALLGQSRSFLYVDGPHQQISIVDEIRDVERTNVSLLHLKTAVNLTRYVQPLFLEKKCVHWLFIHYHISIVFFYLLSFFCNYLLNFRRIYPPAKGDLCVAIGTDNEHVTQSIFLQPILQNCDKCYRCFVETLGTKCPVKFHNNNRTTIIFIY